MDSFSIDVERFAYDVFRISWIKCKIPAKDIPSRQRLENGYSPNFIDSITKYVMFYQSLIRNNMELMMSLELVHVECDCNMFEFFNNFMKLDKEIFKLQVMQNVACSLAICLEMTLYKYPQNKRLFELVPAKWETYFQHFLQQDFLLNGGFEGLLKHAESMHAANYNMDKLIYEFKYGSNILRISEKYSIKIDDKFLNSTFSIDYCSRSDDSRILRTILKSENLPVVGKWIKWTRKRVENCGSFLFRQLPRCIGDYMCSSSNFSPDISIEEHEISAEIDDCAITSMIEDYVQSVEEYHQTN